MTRPELVVSALLEVDGDIDWSSDPEDPDSHMASYADQAVQSGRKEDTLAALRERVKSVYANSPITQHLTPQLKRTKTAFWYRTAIGGYEGRWERARREEDALAGLLRLAREYDILTCRECGTSHGSYSRFMSNEAPEQACPECGALWHPPHDDEPREREREQQP